MTVLNSVEKNRLKTSTDVVALVSVLSNPKASREDRLAALVAFESVIVNERPRTEKTFEVMITGIVRRFLVPRGVDEDFIDVDAVVYHDNLGWRIALLIAFLPAEENLIANLNEEVMEKVCSELSYRGLETIVNDVCVNHLQRRAGNKTTAVPC